MRGHFPVLVLLIALACLWCFSSCKKDTASNNNTSHALASFVLADTSLTLFTEIIQRGNDIGLLARTDSVTILAPTNTAFLNAGITPTIISSMPSSQLDLMSRYYFIPSPVQLSVSAYLPFTTLLGLPVYGVSISNDSTYFNGTRAVKQTVTGSRATIFKLDTPLQLPADSLNHLLATDSTLSFFKTALTHARIVLNPSIGWITLMAPDNNSFISAGYPDTASINSADTISLKNILQYHILAGQYFSNYFLNKTAVTTLQGTSIFTSFTSGKLQFTGNGNSGPAAVIKGNIVTGDNAIVYKITKLLLP